jgi:hypothetical protein
MREGQVQLVDTVRVTAREDVVDIIDSIEFEEAGESGGREENYDYYRYSWEISKEEYETLCQSQFNPANFDFSSWRSEMENKLERLRKEPNEPDDQFSPEVYQGLEVNPDWDRDGDWSHDDYEARVQFYYALPADRFGGTVTREELSKTKTWVVSVPRAFRVLARPPKLARMGCAYCDRPAMNDFCKKCRQWICEKCAADYEILHSSNGNDDVTTCRPCFEKKCRK